MRVIQQTPDELVIRFHPWFKLALSNICIGCGILALVFAEQTTFNCIRDSSQPTQGKCTLTHDNWIIKRQHSWQLEQIKGVSGATSNSSSRVSQIQLNTTQGEVWLPTSRSYEDPPTENAIKIQEFLTSPRQVALELQWDDRGSSVLGFILLGTIGAILRIIAPSVTLHLSQKTGRLTLEQRRSFLGTRTAEYPLDQVVDVMVQKKRHPKLIVMGRMVIRFGGGDQVIVHSYDMACTESEVRRCAEHVDHFLH